MKTLKKHILAGSVAAVLATGAGSAQASIIDHPFFRVLGVVIVWGADSSGNTPVASDFVLMTTGTGNAGADIITGDVSPVVTGTMSAVPANPGANEGTIMEITNPTSGGSFTDSNSNGYLDAGDALTAFGLDATTDVTLASNAVQHSFYVASNTAFDIFAQSSAYTSSGDFTSGAAIGLTLAITTSGTDGSYNFGGNAQDPSTGGSGVFSGSNDIATDLSSLTSVFDGGQRTAASVGAIMGQSVRFDATYTLNDGSGGTYDLSMGAGAIEADVTYTIYVP